MLPRVLSDEPIKVLSEFPGPLRQSTKPCVPWVAQPMAPRAQRG
jgi:hypothetical protein